jgi:anti-sigma factor RsiW
MTCRDFIALLDDYLAGQLPPHSSASFDAHLRCCVDCRNYLDSYRKTVELGKQAFESTDEDIPPGTVPESMIRAALIAASRARR